MVKLLKAEFDICIFEKHKGVNGWTTKAQRTRTVNDIQTKISNLTKTKDNIFLKPKDDRTYGERVDDRWRLNYRGAKAIRKDAVKMVETTI